MMGPRQRARLIAEITSAAEMELRHFGSDRPDLPRLRERVQARLAWRYDTGEVGSVWPIILKLLPLILQIILELSSDDASAAPPAPESVPDVPPYGNDEA